MDPMYVLQPNYMGDTFANSGVDAMVANRGYGVTEALPVNPQGDEDQKKSVNPMVDNLRVQKAREFGKTKQNVGF